MKLREEFAPRNLRVDIEGAALTYDQIVDEEGRDLEVDIVIERRLIAKRRCGVCGDPLYGECAFIGSPPHADRGLFYTPALHLDCARYSFDICPFLASARFAKPGHIPRSDFPGELVLHVAYTYKVLWHRWWFNRIFFAKKPWGQPIIKAGPAFHVERHHGRRSMEKWLEERGGCPDHPCAGLTGCPHHLDNGRQHFGVEG